MLQNQDVARKLMTIIIEAASTKHLDKLYEIETECFKKEAFTKEQIARLLLDQNCISLIAKHEKEIIGFIVGIVYAEDDTTIGHILTIDVSPRYHRRGVGTKLLQEMEKIFKDKNVKMIRLEVREDNIAALNLYDKLGYKKIRKLRRYYGDAHGLLLVKKLI
ncbi:MAG: ribosomal protein S18-alanine N-acetyltransferase [Candidatus Bathyarchaeia archaeon]